MAPDVAMHHERDFNALRRPHQSSDPNPTRHLFNMVEWEIFSIKVLLTNVQLLSDAIMSTWANIVKERFQRLAL